MKQCIFCGNMKKDDEFNREHIIPHALGGRGSEDIITNVCETCNSDLGKRVDSLCLNNQVIEYLRYYYKIKSRKAVPNFLKKEDIEYANTKLYGKIQMDKKGKITGFRANFEIYDIGEGIKFICGPRKETEKYIKKFKENNITANVTKIDLGEPKIPTINDVTITDEGKEDCLLHTYPLMLKMAYEFCVTKLGNGYFDDDYAKDIREYLKNCPKNETIPAEAELKWEEEMENTVSIKLHQEENKLFANVRILGSINGKICVSQNADKYELHNVDSLEIIVADKL